MASPFSFRPRGPHGWPSLPCERRFLIRLSAIETRRYSSLWPASQEMRRDIVTSTLFCLYATDAIFRTHSLALVLLGQVQSDDCRRVMGLYSETAMIFSQILVFRPLQTSSN